MIGVVADDITGAAEIAGIGSGYGLESELYTDLPEGCEGGLVAVDTDSRHCRAQEAARRVEEATKRLRELGAEWIYKKVDSVLRGHVAAEIEAMGECMGKQRAVLVPANPSLGRTIRGGKYFVNGRLLAESDFANDPRQPAPSSDVLEMLGPGGDRGVYFLDGEQALGDEGIFVRDIAGRDDLRRAASLVDDTVVPAGGGDFFTALLEEKGFKVCPDRAGEGSSERCSKSLFVFGSSSEYSRGIVEQQRSKGTAVAAMPEGLFSGERDCSELLAQWAGAAVAAMEECGRVIVCIEQPVVRDDSIGGTLCGYMADLVESVLGRFSEGSVGLFIEGGATASAVIRKAGWRQFKITGQLGRGVVTMRTPDGGQYVTIKPGSYEWPDEMF